MTTENWREKYLKEAEKVEPSIVTRPVPVPPLSELPDDSYRIVDAQGNTTDMRAVLITALLEVRRGIDVDGCWTLRELLAGVLAISQASAMRPPGSA